MSTSDIILLAVSCVLMVYCPLLMVYCLLMLARNEMIFRFQMRANSICYQLGDWTFYDNKPSYEAMMHDLSKWTFAEFYPELAVKP